MSANLAAQTTGLLLGVYLVVFLVAACGAYFVSRKLTEPAVLNCIMWPGLLLFEGGEDPVVSLTLLTAATAWLAGFAIVAVRRRREPTRSDLWYLYSAMFLMLPVGLVVFSFLQDWWLRRTLGVL
ncbi:MAG: hypothetical protein A3K19_06315 [Lentisphaerae bacterium RIFOXYB12_FULL_65_16]|nr:MAG: hypothetical protein A3K18_26730 [Lentisphaerae bacterium RIFOXYA12_64_32]OGV93235.1 MAG: hypothetical protein A3K19_06315 [Lentisphaerae bacterium RIFOXYB12_FULL_65_16]